MELLRRIAAPLCVLFLGCGGGDGAVPSSDAAPSGEDFDRRGLLAHLATTLLAPTYQEFAERSDELVAAIAAHCDALDAGGGDATLAPAQAAWRAAVDVWERVDAVLVGPAAMDTRALRDRVYAWPLAATCGVDQDVVSFWEEPGAHDVGAQLNNVRSLAAVEYLLFVSAAEHTCALPPPGWDDLAADLPPARCGLARAIAADVDAQADALWAAWDPAGGSWGAQLAGAGTSSSEIGSEREAVNLVADAFFYVDGMVKDMKLAEPAGIAVNSCGTVEEACLREVEHPHADHATASIRINLRALREAFTGTPEYGDDGDDGDGLGFDDHLGAVGAADLSTRMLADLDAAIAAADALPDSFLGALQDDRASVVATHAAVKVFTDDLKTEFLTVLGLDIPDDAAGDND